ncbi:hypothetical protein K2O51_31245 (plasmid) [Cupriavidus pinatubonensis]|uniref:hypothetical protein n=1 Tax=Cupriavidus pinatubonensis TaxID=248026 RepID=UPI001C7364B6|nr:hypothetical protein [Cupriavidus pinatubonensis]QYY33720.1 hypothetical protein K2O51_31245 [Cupriavidus pinatubonensis]
MKAAIRKAYALDTPPESEGTGPDAWNVEGAARFANRLLWSALVDIVAVEKAIAANQPVSPEKQELAVDSRVWIGGAEDCPVTFDTCVELLFSSEIPDLADKLRIAIEADPARVLALVEEAMREAEYESTVYRFMQRGPGEQQAAPLEEYRVQATGIVERTSIAETAAAAMLVEVPALPVQSAVAVRALAGGQYLLPLFDDPDELDQLVSAYDSRSARYERARGM